MVSTDLRVPGPGRLGHGPDCGFPGSAFAYPAMARDLLVAVRLPPDRTTLRPGSGAPPLDWIARRPIAAGRSP
jgi:hypothetical protein